MYTTRSSNPVRSTDVNGNDNLFRKDCDEIGNTGKKLVVSVTSGVTRREGRRVLMAKLNSVVHEFDDLSLTYNLLCCYTSPHKIISKLTPMWVSFRISFPQSTGATCCSKSLIEIRASDPGLMPHSITGWVRNQSQTSRAV